MTDVYVCQEAETVERLHHDIFENGFATLTIKEQLNRQAAQILAGHQTKDAAVPVHLRSWLPGAAGKSNAEVFEMKLTLADTRLAIAREYGFRDWDHVEAEGTHPPDKEFERAVDAVVHGDIDSLKQLLAQRPNLVNARSAYGHRSTLLHYIGANGVETHRQKTPLNAVEVTQLLIDAGADVNAEAEMYGGGSTVLGLLLSSAHPAEAGVTDDVAAVLKQAAANIN